MLVVRKMSEVRMNIEHWLNVVTLNSMAIVLNWRCLFFTGCFIKRENNGMLDQKYEGMLVVRKMSEVRMNIGVAKTSRLRS